MACFLALSNALWIDHICSFAIPKYLNKITPCLAIPIFGLCNQFLPLHLHTFLEICHKCQGIEDDLSCQLGLIILSIRSQERFIIETQL